MGRFFSVEKIYLASPRGFCSGVERAVKTVELVLNKFGTPIYVKHQIVHNQHVVDCFKKKGVIFVEDLKDIPDNSIVILSAHGSAPNIYEEARKKNLKIFDATCPLVTKVHIEAKKYEKEGYFIFYIGHFGHPEPTGVLGEVVPSSIALIETVEDVISVKIPQAKKLVVLSQTTLSFDETKKIIANLKKRFPNLIVPPASDICFSTQNRQNAVKKLAKKVELILVVGSKESSNSNRLVELAKGLGVAAHLINDKTEIKSTWFVNIKNLGITAGASAPENLIQDIISSIADFKTQIKELVAVVEKTHFPLPNNLK